MASVPTLALLLALLQGNGDENPPRRDTPPVVVGDSRRPAPPVPASDKVGPQDGTDDAEEDPESRPVVNRTVPKVRRAEAPLPNYRVLLRTKGGRKFSGIVCKDRRFHAQVYAGAHHRPELYSSGERFTLKFVDGLDGELRISWSQLAKLDVKEILDGASLREMQEEQHRSRVVRSERDARRRAEEAPPVPTEESGSEAPKGGPDGPPAPSSNGGGETPPSQEFEVPRTALLLEFPPEAGWGLERKEKIEWRRTVLGLFPDEAETRFLEQFDAWQAEFTAWEAAVAKAGPGKGAPPKAGTDAPGAGEKGAQGDEGSPPDPPSSGEESAAGADEEPDRSGAEASSSATPSPR